MNKTFVSAFLLERYHIGEVTPKEKKLVEEALNKDESLINSLENLKQANIDFFKKYPASDNIIKKSLSVPKRRLTPVTMGICAAAMAAFIAVPLFVFNNSADVEFGDRIKGSSISGNSIELNIFLKENSAGDVIMLPDNSGISEGNTIQLVYRVLGVSTAEKYGTIFSIDGRSYVTMHYPYTPWQSTLLVSGRYVPLEAAFTLDDAPNYEIFFFVASETPINLRDIYETANQLAEEINRKPQDAFKMGTEAFKNYELEVFTLLKE
ncbi:MAG: hypothetical protein FWD14_08145 [Treponema sp.]|nr:hypothetical protein [Treponema sp.]